MCLLMLDPLSVFQVKELPTYKDTDFRNNMQKVYVSDEEKEKFMDKLSRDIEVPNNIFEIHKPCFPICYWCIRVCLL